MYYNKYDNYFEMVIHFETVKIKFLFRKQKDLLKEYRREKK